MRIDSQSSTEDASSVQDCVDSQSRTEKSILSPGLRMRNFTWNRFPIKILLIDSLLTPIVESTYLNRDMCKFESSQKDESRWQSTDSSKAYRNTSAFKCPQCLYTHSSRKDDFWKTWLKWVSGENKLQLTRPVAMGNSGSVSPQIVLWPVLSPRGALVGLALPNKAPSPPNWNMKH